MNLNSSNHLFRRRDREGCIGGDRVRHLPDRIAEHGRLNDAIDQANGEGFRRVEQASREENVFEARGSEQIEKPCMVGRR